MPAQVLENEQFLDALKDLLESTKESGSVWITQKRLTYQSQPADDAMDTSDSAPSSSHSCVVKATDGKASLTTHIAPSLLPPFAERYNALLRAAFAPHLRKRDKKKEKARAEEIVKRKKELEAVVDRTLGSAGKRGSAGRSKRQRQIKSLKKAEAELGRIEKREERKKTAASSGEGAMPAVDPSS